MIVQSDSLNTVLAGLASKLGVGVEKIWPYLVEATRLEGQMQVAAGIFLLVLAGLATVTSIVRAAYECDEFFTMLLMIGAVLFTIFGALFAMTGYPLMMAPEAYAFRKLLP